MIPMAATKSDAFDSTVSRRRVLAVLGGLALAAPLSPGTAESEAPRDDLVIRDGWILRRDDLTRLR